MVEPGKCQCEITKKNVYSHKYVVHCNKRANLFKVSGELAHVYVWLCDEHRIKMLTKENHYKSIELAEGCAT